MENRSFKPVIGITPDFDGDERRYFLRERYAAAVAECGGVPLILPYQQGPDEVAVCLDRIHGLVLTGGNFDIDSCHYGETPSVPQRNVIEMRTRFELEIARQALERDLPVLGICGGEQCINVALKGSLFQDIRTQVPGALEHERKGLPERLHRVRVLPGTLLHAILEQEALDVNTSHHQSVKAVGRGMAVSALADDGVIEGIESTRHGFALGVQWHPEYFSEQNSGGRRIFSALMEKAGEYGKS